MYILFGLLNRDEGGGGGRLQSAMAGLKINEFTQLPDGPFVCAYKY